MPKYLKLEDMSIVTQQGKEGGSVPFQCPIHNGRSGDLESIAPPAEVAVDEKKNKSARAFIFQAVPEDILLQVSKKKTAKEIWEALKLRYLGADRVQKARLHTLNSDFEALRMKDGETIDVFAGKLSGMVSKYSSLGATLEDNILVRKLLDSVPDKYLQLVASIEKYSDIDTMPFEEAIGRLKAYEDRLRLRSGNTSGETSLLLTRTEGQSSHKYSRGGSSTGGRGRGSSYYGRGGRFGGRDRGSIRGRGGRGSAATFRDSNNNQFKGKDKSHIRCFNCDEYGHYASDCKAPKEKNDEANLTQAQEEEPALLLTVCGEDSNTMVLLNEDKVFPDQNEGKCRNLWYLDTGASNHMTGNWEFFYELNTKVTGQVRFGDGSKVRIEGKGSILLKCKNGEHQIVYEVYYIPALRSNIRSLGQLTEEGCKIEMLDENLFVHDEYGKLIMKVQRSKNRLYKINLHITQPVCLAISLDDEAWLWHARLSHVNFQVLELMVKKNMVRGVPRVKHPTQVCEGYMVAKQTRQPFPKETEYRATKPLELVHADLCGPISPQTLGGNQYFLLIVDDYSRFMWVYVISTKDEAFPAFKRFKAQVETESTNRVKMLRTDRGGEFTSRQFNEFCDKEGVKRQLTAPYTPQQNGVVERRNQTILETTRSLLKAMNVLESLWGEAVRHAVYILNRVPTKGLKNMTPYEGWKGKKPSLEHGKVFGCVAHVKNPANHLMKLSDRSSKMVYLGAEPGSKAHRLYNPSQNKVCVARDVFFDEKTKWNWDDAQSYRSASSPGWINIQVPDDANEGENRDQNPNGEEVGSPIQQFETTNSQSLLNTPLTMTGNIGTSENSGSSQEVSPSAYDHTPVRGFRKLTDIYARLEPVEVEQEELMFTGEEPKTFQEAMTDPNWREAMRKELESINKNQTWNLTKLPPGKIPIGLKWVYKLKKDAEGNIVKYKARLVAKGYVQRKGVDFEEVFAPVARLETIRLLLALAAWGGWQVHHLDVKSAFLNGTIQEEVYVTQPNGFVVAGKEQMVYKLHKALYGLRQAPRAWNIRLDKALKDLGFQRCPQEQAVYKKQQSKDLLLIGVYVDDLIVTRTSESQI
ncbi:hypothetical protein OSB04_006884 [Centaurea solstitialis]|uniref:Uncharacterized protein n=1 Tax=Centaurea solstitialis TaxID=347529 RepID=A0AA38WS97_9ASTR|nr:hypothetical protein OSB04_006884 [Centaurea solstitialis]